MEQEVAKYEPWPLSRNWWLHVQSHRGEGDFRNFDFIKITAESGETKRLITSIMVPKIDGLVCESHSFISALIHQNCEALKAENARLIERIKKLREALQWIKERNYGAKANEASEALEADDTLAEGE